MLDKGNKDVKFVINKGSERESARGHLKEQTGRRF